MSDFAPMLAAKADLSKLRYPLYCSAKLDGIRAIVRNGVVLSRKLEPIPNTFVQEALRHLEHLDGELIVGEPTSPNCFRTTSSGVMSIEGKPDVMFYVFDHVEVPHMPFRWRADKLPAPPYRVWGDRVRTHTQHLITSPETLLRLEERILNEGYEGLILRDPDAPYKHGRSTTREQYLLKLKRMATSEAVILKLIEQEHNGNVAMKDELGHTKRSSHKENKIGKGTMGALLVRDLVTGVEFNIGTGFTDAERKQIWDAPEYFIGKIISYNHLPIGAKEKPRHPSYKGLRDKRDM